MELSEVSSRLIKALDDAITADLSDEERDEIKKIVRQALLDTSSKTQEQYKEVAVICCGPEADLAHKIQEQMDKTRDMLIANLKSMR